MVAFQHVCAVAKQPSCIIHLGTLPQNGMKIGYAYDLTLSDLSDYTSGSHEIMLSFDVKRESGRIKSPRFF